jgi:hypothetical protein
LAGLILRRGNMKELGTPESNVVHL